MQISRFRHPRLTIEELTISAGESWCFYGSGRSGLNEFLALLEGRLEGGRADILELPEAPAIISFSVQQEIFEEEIRNDDSDFLNRPDPGTLAHEFLPPDALASPLIDHFDMRGALLTGYRQLSSGQSRKLLLLRALLSGATTIVIDSPYDGLDPHACRELDRAFAQMERGQLRILVLVRNGEDIPVWSDRVAVFRKSSLSEQGPRRDMMVVVAHLAAATSALFQESPTADDAAENLPLPDPLLQLVDGFASYGTTRVFSGLNLSISRGEHTLVTGPNGCGKSTLLQIITGDNPKCYANNLTIFGRRRGTGESIWELKKHMGIFSPEIHRTYRVPGSALQVVLSGLFDSIGLYHKVSSHQERTAAAWLAAIDLADQAATPFRRLAYGDQRLVLIARALIKLPPLLVLDEPTQGLDSDARKALLDFLETVSRGERTTLLYVSHRQDEYRSFFRQHLHLENFKPA